jgi:hypothetical protein
MENAAEKSGHGKILRRVGWILEQLGFERSRQTFFVRRREHVIEFVHLHKFSFDSSYRIHLGLRVLNDTFQAPSLNGPHSDDYRGPNSPNGSRYSLRYGPEPATILRCVEEIFRWCLDVGEPWFERNRDPTRLIQDGSPLNKSEQERLRLALDGQSDPAYVQATIKQLGLGRTSG